MPLESSNVYWEYIFEFLIKADFANLAALI